MNCSLIFFTGCMWSICGIHDQGWAERPIFGKIRFMNYAGCKRKFDVAQFESKYAAKKEISKKDTKTSVWLNSTQNSVLNVFWQTFFFSSEVKFINKMLYFVVWWFKGYCLFLSLVFTCTTSDQWTYNCGCICCRVMHRRLQKCSV